MLPLRGYTTPFHAIIRKWLFSWRKKATRIWRPTANIGTNLSDPDRFRSMHLKSRRYVLDTQGRWWAIELRHCLHTGLIIKVTRRISD